MIKNIMAKRSIKNFDPQRLAYLDTQMIKAYYSHRFLRMFILLVRVFREQVGVNFIIAARLAYFSARAAVIFRRTGDLKQTEAFLIKFYKLIDKHAVESVDSARSAKTELHWWLVHRYPKRYKQTLPQAVSEAKAALFNISPKSLEQFGREYAAATDIRDKATHIDHVEPDWNDIQKHLERAYVSIHRAVNSNLLNK